ncbi:DUF389 domain-containing protein [Sphingomonas sp. ac-8]|uniref:DUF389 domain-containing protein n=1 Tax=Sphingomonas sp. ac-8 TaxID=3242977 RepID=UPI003A808BBF
MDSIADDPAHVRYGQQNPLYRWWRETFVDSVDHGEVMERICDDSGWSPRYAFMTMMSAGIAVLGLLLSSPAVVIGAMLISPLMGPILGLGFSLALFDFKEMRRSLSALGVGSGLAIGFTALIVLVSPLQAATEEIIARTRPNLFDLGVALFAALAGTFAIIRGRGETIVGVAIATALMPPLAVVGYGLATWNLAVLGGSLALYATNFVTIGLAAMLMARLYGFGHALSSQQSWAQTAVLILVFVAMAIPLGLSLRQIAGEALATTQVRSTLSERFGVDARVTQLSIDFDARPIAVRAVVITPRARMQQTKPVAAQLRQDLGQPVTLRLDQVLLEPGAGALAAQRAEMRHVSEALAVENEQAVDASRLVALAAGIAVDGVTIDRNHHRATAAAAPLPGATLATYRSLETRLSAQIKGWQIALVPPRVAFPQIAFANGVDVLSQEAQEAVVTSAWAALRWNSPRLGVPGLPETVPERPVLAVRRALAIAAILRDAGIAPIPAPAAGATFTLLEPLQ